MVRIIGRLLWWWPIVRLTIRGPGRLPSCFLPATRCSENPFIARGGSMAELRARWLAFYAERVEPVSKEIFSHIEKMIIGTLILSAGAHVSSTEPAIVLFGLSAPRSRRPRRHVVWCHSAGAEFPRRPLQARKAQLAYRVPNPDDDFLRRPLGPTRSAHPRLSPGNSGRSSRHRMRRAITARRTGPAHPCMRETAKPRWWRGTARSARRRAQHRRRSSGHRRRRPTAARTALRAAALAAARSLPVRQRRQGLRRKRPAPWRRLEQPHHRR